MKRFVICIIMVFILIPSLSVSANTSFADVKETDWYYETVTEMAQRGLFAGKGNNLFCPHDKMTKAEFIAVVVRSLFPNEDLTPKQGEKWWMPSYSIALETALITENEITSSGSGTFLYGTTVTRVSDLEQPIQRQMMAMISVRALEILGETDVKAYNEDYIPDYSDVGTYYRYYVCNAYGAGIIVGDENGNFNPKNTLTRAEASTVLYRIIEKSARIKVDFPTDAIEENKQYTSNGLPSINPNNGFAVPNELVNSTSTAPITIYEGQLRSNRPAKAGDTFVKKDGTKIILQKDQYGIVGGSQGVAPDIGLFYNGNTCSKNGTMTYDGLSGGLLWTDSTGKNINNQSYQINASTGEGHWGLEWQHIESLIPKPSYEGSYNGEVSKDAYKLYQWDSIMEMWVANHH